MKTLGEVLKLSQSFLKVPRARRVSEELLAHVLQCKRMELYMQFDRPIVESELTVLRELLKRAAKNEPLQYIVGSVEFLGCTIKVDPRCLIPRQETEILADLIVKRVKSGILWDVCTGSGCLGISIKKKRPDLTVVLSDISPDALALARENAKLNEVDVEILEGDLLEPFKGRKANYIVCNPPYIAESEYFTLDPSVRDFEPKGALVSGKVGTEYYSRLKRELDPNSTCFFEIGAGQGEAVKEIFKNERYELISDWAGHPRFFLLERQ